jgi:hypothetical protein
MSTTATLRFAPQWDITDFQAKFTSLNTSGISWEYTVLSFLRPDGTPFSTAPTIGHYDEATSLMGSPSQGWYVAASKEVVKDVGTNLTGFGLNAPLTGLRDDLTLTYALVGLAPNTPIGGLVWTTYLEDTRGINNGSTNLTASWTEFTVSGVTHAATPIPTPALLPSLMGLGLLVRRRFAGYS